MKVRTVAVASVLLVAALPSVSHAAAKKKQPPPVCNLVRDDLNDTVTSPAVAADSLDIAGGDIASDGKKLTAVIRLKSWADTEATAPIGRTYKIQFTGKGGDTYAFLSYMTTPVGSSFHYGYYDNQTGVDTGNGQATGRVDAAKKEIRITTALNNLVVNVAGSNTGTFKKGASISGIRVVTGRWLGAYAGPGFYGGNTHFADTADGARSYRSGDRSCVKVG